MTVNRYCASGVETIAIATAKIRAGMADCIVAGGVESMSLVPTVGWRTVLNFETAKEHPDYYIGMGLTAENVAREFKVSRKIQMRSLMSRIRKLSMPSITDTSRKALPPSP